jgi:hypothetical protein
LIKKCPSATWVSGSNDVHITLTSNLGTFAPKIIKKNGVGTIINYTTLTGGVYKFIDLQPAVYIFEHSTSACSNVYYDTITTQPYIFPTLQNSSIYQCDNNGFSVSTGAVGGIAPFNYEIIGSTPSTPSLVSAPQSSPAFNISNGTSYSLVRLRAVDACGNAALNDANVLPLGNVTSTVSSDCYYNEIVLTTDSFPSATYTWYKKTSPTDSVQIATNTAHYTIPYMLPTDTGRYVCKVSINNGCLIKLAYYDITGWCNGLLLPIDITLYGKPVNNQNLLYWQNVLPAGEVSRFVVERADANSRFTEVGSVTAVAGNQGHFEFFDRIPLPGNNLYRIKTIYRNSSFLFSNSVMIKRGGEAGITLFPNPVKNVLHIQIAGTERNQYQYNIESISGAVIYKSGVVTMQSGIIQHHLGTAINAGVFNLRLVNISTGQVTMKQVLIQK